jgi:hypothetical protein
MIITGRYRCSLKREGLYVVLTVIVTIMTIAGRCICSVNSYCDNSGGSICSVNSFCYNNDNNGEVYM